MEKGVALSFWENWKRKQQQKTSDTNLLEKNLKHARSSKTTIKPIKSEHLKKTAITKHTDRQTDKLTASVRPPSRQNGHGEVAIPLHRKQTVVVVVLVLLLRGNTFPPFKHSIQTQSEFELLEREGERARLKKNIWFLLRRQFQLFFVTTNRMTNRQTYSFVHDIVMATLLPLCEQISGYGWVSECWSVGRLLQLLLQ